MTRSTKFKPWGIKAARIMNAALEAVDPRSAVQNSMKRTDDIIEVNSNTYDLKRINRILLVGAGKAGQPMVSAVQKILGTRLADGYVIVKEGYANKVDAADPVEIIEAGHPVPDSRGVTGTEKIIQLLENTRPDDLVICLISGGGSALMVSPVKGVTLQDLQSLTGVLLASGATINEINILRKHLDRVKGGQIARYASPAKLICLILSDVVGDPLDVIASGPTVPDPSTFKDALSILERYQIIDQIPFSIKDHLYHGRDGKLDETPKPGEQTFSRVNNLIVASNRTATHAALQQAQLEGFNTSILTNYIQGEASQVGKVFAAILHQMADANQPLPRPACLIVGGETTVTMQGDGLGGRNQEIALSAVRDLAGLFDVALITLATDGGDGPTEAAGAVVTGDSFQRAQNQNMDPHTFLVNNNAYNFFKPLDDLLITGPIQTNVNDLAFLFAF
ncbi:MAG: glycerate kinase [Anaerolineales bacterium]